MSFSTQQHPHHRADVRSLSTPSGPSLFSELLLWRQACVLVKERLSDRSLKTADCVWSVYQAAGIQRDLRIGRKENKLFCFQALVLARE